MDPQTSMKYLQSVLAMGLLSMRLQVQKTPKQHSISKGISLGKRKKKVKKGGVVILLKDYRHVMLTHFDLIFLTKCQ